MGRVTLVGALMARPGFEYRFSQRCEVADRCPVATTCQNLTVGRSYKVLSTRPIRHTVCTEHEDGVVQAVEVEELPLVANIPESQLRGTLIRYQTLTCTQRGCPNWATCFENGLIPDQQYVVKGAGEKVVCPMGYSLREVPLADAP